jgi:hypothetical protein
MSQCGRLVRRAASRMLGILSQGTPLDPILFSVITACAREQSGSSRSLSAGVPYLAGLRWPGQRPDINKKCRTGMGLPARTSASAPDPWKRRHASRIALRNGRIRSLPGGRNGRRFSLPPVQRRSFLFLSLVIPKRFRTCISWCNVPNVRTATSSVLSVELKMARIAWYGIDFQAGVDSHPFSSCRRPPLGQRRLALFLSSGAEQKSAATTACGRAV